MGILVTYQYEIAAVVIFLAQSVIVFKIRSASTFLLFAGALVHVVAFAGYEFLPYSIEVVELEDGAITTRDMGWAPFFGSMATSGILTWLAGLGWFALDVARGKIANRSFNTDAGNAGAG